MNHLVRFRAYAMKRASVRKVLVGLFLLAYLMAFVWYYQLVPVLYRTLQFVSDRLVFVLLTAVIAVVVALWKVPKWQADRWKSTAGATNLPELEDKARATLAQIFAGLILLAGLYFTWQQVSMTQQQLAVAEQGQITDRFAKAVEQLGDESANGSGPRLESRIGAIYSLERIAQDSERDRGPVGEVLSAYVRSNAPWSQTGPEQVAGQRGPREDIQAAMNVLTLNLPGNHCGSWHLYPSQLRYSSLGLQNTDLRRAVLDDANLGHADLVNSHLEGSSLVCALLDDANLQGAHFEGADLSGASLEYAHTDGAHLEGAVLTDSDLANATLKGAHLEKANLTGAKGLTQAQVASAITDSETKLPKLSQ